MPASRSAESRTAILAQIAAGQPATCIIADIVALCETADPVMRAVLHLLDPAARLLRRQSQGTIAPALRDALDQVPLHDTEIPWVRCACTGRSVAVADLSGARPLRAIVPGISAYGSCWCEPIRAANSDLLGTWTFFRSSTASEKPWDLDLIQFASCSAAMALQSGLGDESGRLAGRAGELAEPPLSLGGLAEFDTRRPDRLATLAMIAASVAHEIRSPISAAWIAAECARKMSADPGNTTGLTESLDTICNALSRCGGIIDSVLRLAQQSPSPKGRCDLNAVIRRAVEASQSDSAARRAVVLLELDEKLPEIVAHDVELEQVISNLLLNAAHSGTAVRVQIRTECHTQGVRVFVQDDGRGISADDLPHIFDPFFSRHASPRNLGLGLALCRHIIDEHGGAIEVRSQCESGTTIVISLPLGSCAYPRT